MSARTTITVLALAASTFATTGLATADDGAPPAARVPAVDARDEAAQPSAPAVAVPKALACTCKPAKLPLYVEDWGRLADLVRDDREVFGKADFWRRRQESTRWLAAGILGGVGAAGLATFDRLRSERWSEGNKWFLTGGLLTAAVSTLAYWAYSPDRDDLLTVVNHWNLRHPDQPLAP